MLFLREWEFYCCSSEIEGKTTENMLALVDLVFDGE